MFRIWFVLRIVWVLGAVWCAATPATASPWAEVGDRGLRTDLEILATYGLVRGPLTIWPLPWAQISSQLPGDNGVELPAHVRRALKRVRKRLKKETGIGRIRTEFVSRLTNQPALVRDFGTTARDDVDARVRFEYLSRSTAFRLAVGDQSAARFSDLDIEFDDSVIAQVVGNWLFYGGSNDHWWGPGQIGSLILSNNARPFPRIGLMRNNPTAFETPWLSWLGPWQINVFTGVLDDDRTISDTLVLGARLAINPLPGLEFGVSRTIQTCGSGRPCSLSSLTNAIVGRDNTGSVSGDPGNQLAGADLRLAMRLGEQSLAFYGQLIGEDEASGRPSKLAGLFGMTLSGGIGGEGALWRLTGEFADTTASFGRSNPDFDVFYNHFIYQTGFRYQGRSIGHSLDGDSRLYSVVGTLTDLRAWTYRLAFHRAEINRDGGGTQFVSASAEDVNLVELGLEIPLNKGSFDIGLRIQDDQPNTPGVKDEDAALELGWTIRF